MPSASTPFSDLDLADLALSIDIEPLPDLLAARAGTPSIELMISTGNGREKSCDDVDLVGVEPARDTSDDLPRIDGLERGDGPRREHPAHELPHPVVPGRIDHDHQGRRGSAGTAPWPGRRRAPRSRSRSPSGPRRRPRGGSARRSRTSRCSRPAPRRASAARPDTGQRRTPRSTGRSPSCRRRCRAATPVARRLRPGPSAPIMLPPMISAMSSWDRPSRAWAKLSGSARPSGCG